MSRTTAMRFFFFFFNDTATTEIYTLSLHDALPIAFREELLHFAVEAHADENRVALGGESFRARRPLGTELLHRARPGRVQVAGAGGERLRPPWADDRRRPGPRSHPAGSLRTGLRH